MVRDRDRLVHIFYKTDGRCHICWGNLTANAYANTSHAGGWEVEHGKARAKGGTDHLNNLWPAHIACNRNKGIATARSARAWNGRRSAPLSAAKKAAARESNTMSGAAAGAMLGLAGGPVGALVGAVLGGLIGNDVDPEGGKSIVRRAKRPNTGKAASSQRKRTSRRK